MVDDKLQAIITKLDGTNYSYWSHVMKNFIMDKGMWNYMIGVTIRPTESQETEADVAKWDKENAQILTWFHNSVQTTNGMNFSKYSTSKQLLDSYTKHRKKQHLVEFLMAVHDQFEPLQGAILHWSPLPSMDGVVCELIVEETWFKVAHGAPASQLVFATPPFLPTPPSPLFQVIGKPKPRVSMDECSFCRQKGHWKRSMFEQFKSFMVGNPNISSQAFIMTTTQLGLSGSSPSGNIHTSWIFYSGCSHHMTPVASLLNNCVSPSSSITIATANGSSIPDRVSKRQIGIGCRVGELYVLDSLHDRVSKRQIGIGCRVGELYVLDSLHFSTTIKVLRFDLGAEYYLFEFEKFLATHGTIHQSSCSDTLAQNGRAERKHRHLLDTARSLLLSYNAPNF
ncbi:uncharacterized protein LOC114286457 [Camellia sinensis]|uniref:uncharacterized protein LOC114286457 n=1 Tax=Camellia sinensis TaxID=4442 RepID=UPI001035AA11|nr:uncharacterized protein LOC114286457 [Camellia sinensis]